MAASGKERRIVRLVAGAVIAIVLLAGFASFVRTMLSGKSAKTQRQVQIVQIIRPPPPPPDQPPPPPPEKTQEPLPPDKPDETPPDQADAPPAALGLDADGAAGADAFGLAARKGGSDLIGGNGTAAFAWYTNRIKDAITERLQANSKLAGKKYSTSVRVWIDPDGSMRVKLATTTGNRETDEGIEAALSGSMRMGDAPPLEMPQPVSLKIVSHS